MLTGEYPSTDREAILLEIRKAIRDQRTIAQSKGLGPRLRELAHSTTGPLQRSQCAVASRQVANATSVASAC